MEERKKWASVEQTNQEGEDDIEKYPRGPGGVSIRGATCAPTTLNFSRLRNETSKEREREREKM